MPVAPAADSASAAAIPDYAAAKPASKKAQMQAIAGLVLGIAGIPCALSSFFGITPYLGVGLGIAGLVIGLMARPARKTLGTLAIVFGGIAILAGIVGLGLSLTDYQKSQSGAAGGSVKNTVKQDDNLGY